jgi:hypothetical protein
MDFDRRLGSPPARDDSWYGLRSRLQRFAAPGWRSIENPQVGWASSTSIAARQLVKRLRRGRTLDPVLVGLLRESLSDMLETELADDLDEAADWVGSSDEERGATLRGLLRLSDAIVRSRDAPSPRRGEPYPHIDSEER